MSSSGHLPRWTLPLFRRTVTGRGARSTHSLSGTFVQEVGCLGNLLTSGLVVQSSDVGLLSGPGPGGSERV